MNTIPMMNRTDGMKKVLGPSPFRNSRTATAAAASKNTMPMKRFSSGAFISYRLSSLTALRMMAGAADLHHAHFRRGLALFATVFTILRRRAPAGFPRTLVPVLFVRHLD
jgi:hypothetical protein